MAIVLKTRDGKGYGETRQMGQVKRDRDGPLLRGN